ncbi:hypothetical protein H6F67_14455 [Microcoleus sp. FACHB-1515]|uniref:hypothetical protein n=1 Tax=Cyanophyceae TaxID=3028117 RepID=UPI001687054E|nr:hypothetical protein [Microcoleus sp. FACHB-1515]MBD2091052.1 hypothetical protein [Microcoleus sp. FACHB-1515]
MNVTLQYDESSLLCVDELIDRNWPDGVTGNMDQLVLIWGSFIGECLRTILNGEWVMTDAGWGVRCNDIVAHPFNKVEKRFRNGTGDSISFFYQALVGTLNPSEQ